MSLGNIGINSLGAVNQWIGIIDSNLQGASRVAYKPTRPSLTDGLGIDTVRGKSNLPSATLTVQGTTIEWGQGDVLNTGINTDFAIQGEGFFVVVDAAGRYYATRDGEFHWGTDGYLYNSMGLKVLSNGQDFIRYDNSDRDDIFNYEGESQYLTKYGDKSLLLVDVGNRNGLRFSQYGATTFEIPGNIPLRLRNSFDETTDGITFVYDDPAFVRYVDDPGFVPFNAANPLASDFAIDFGANGIFRWSVDGPAPGLGLDITNINSSIDSIVNAINSWATLNSVNVTVTWDNTTDRLEIVNDTTPPPIPFPPPPPGDDRIIFMDDPNGRALRQFFQLPLTIGPTGTGVTRLISKRDIDNSSLRDTADIGSGFVLSSQALSDLLNPPAPTYLHDKANGRILVDARNNGSHMIVGEGQKTSFFDMEFSFRISDDVQAAGTGSGGNFTIYQGQGSGNPGPQNQGPDSNLNLHQTGGNPLVIDAAAVPFLNVGDTICVTDNQGNPTCSVITTIDAGGFIPQADTNALLGTAFPTDVILVWTNNPLGSQNNSGTISLGSPGTPAVDGLLTVGFGQERANELYSEGYQIQYNPNNGDISLVVMPPNVNSGPPTVVQTFAGAMPITGQPAAGTPPAIPGATHQFIVQLQQNGLLKVTVVDGANSANSNTVFFNVDGIRDDLSGYLSINNLANVLEIQDLYVDYKHKYNDVATGPLASVSPTDYSADDIRRRAQDRPRGRIMQAALEQSTASLTEYVPMLALAQKVFSSLSKIISTFNALQDDVNSLIR